MGQMNAIYTKTEPVFNVGIERFFIAIANGAYPMNSLSMFWFACLFWFFGFF